MRRDEQLSALMDGQLEDDQLRFLLQGLKDDEEARQKWRRYHVIGDAMRGAPARSLEADFSAAVMAEIAADPNHSVGAVDDGGLGAEPAWVKRVVSFAVAASVATVALFVANDRGLFESSSNQPAYVASVPANTNEGLNPGLKSGDSSPAFSSVIQASTVASSVAEWNEVPSDIQQKLDRYLLNHAQTATGVPGQNMSQYIRLVGHRQQPAASDVDVVNPAAEEQSNNGVTSAQTSAAEQ